MRPAEQLLLLTSSEKAFLATAKDKVVSAVQIKALSNYHYGSDSARISGLKDHRWLPFSRLRIMQRLDWAIEHKFSVHFN